MFFKISTLPPSMHQKLTKHGRYCKQNNQFPTRSHVELEDDNMQCPFQNTQLEEVNSALVYVLQNPYSDSIFQNVIKKDHYFYSKYHDMSYRPGRSLMVAANLVKVPVLSGDNCSPRVHPSNEPITCTSWPNCNNQQYQLW